MLAQRTGIPATELNWAVPSSKSWGVVTQKMYTLLGWNHETPILRSTKFAKPYAYPLWHWNWQKWYPWRPSICAQLTGFPNTFWLAGQFCLVNVVVSHGYDTCFRAIWANFGKPELTVTMEVPPPSRLATIDFRSANSTWLSWTDLNTLKYDERLCRPAAWIVTD